MYDYQPRSLLIHDNATMYPPIPLGHGPSPAGPNPIMVMIKAGLDRVSTFGARIRGSASTQRGDTPFAAPVTVITLDDVIRDIANKDVDWVLAA